MNRFFIRLIALALTACLIADPIANALAVPFPVRRARHAAHMADFNAEALALHPESPLHSETSEVQHHVIQEFEQLERSRAATPATDSPSMVRSADINRIDFLNNKIPRITVEPDPGVVIQENLSRIATKDIEKELVSWIRNKQYELARARISILLRNDRLPRSHRQYLLVLDALARYLQRNQSAQSFTPYRATQMLRILRPYLGQTRNPDLFRRQNDLAAILWNHIAPWLPEGVIPFLEANPIKDFIDHEGTRRFQNLVSLLVLRDHGYPVPQVGMTSHLVNPRGRNIVVFGDISDQPAVILTGGKNLRANFILCLDQRALRRRNDANGKPALFVSYGLMSRDNKLYLVHFPQPLQIEYLGGMGLEQIEDLIEGTGIPLSKDPSEIDLGEAKDIAAYQARQVGIQTPSEIYMTHHPLEDMRFPDLVKGQASLYHVFNPTAPDLMQAVEKALSAFLSRENLEKFVIKLLYGWGGVGFHILNRDRISETAKYLAGMLRQTTSHVVQECLPSKTIVRVFIAQGLPHRYHPMMVSEGTPKTGHVFSTLETFARASKMSAARRRKLERWLWNKSVLIWKILLDQTRELQGLDQKTRIMDWTTVEWMLIQTEKEVKPIFIEANGAESGNMGAWYRLMSLGHGHGKPGVRISRLNEVTADLTRLMFRRAKLDRHPVLPRAA